MEAPLTLLYTYGLRGDLDRLPRLHSLLKALREEAQGRVLTLDLGRSCDPAVWPCDVTEGRSTLIALDAMGYTAANVADDLDAANRDRLRDQVMMALVDDAHPHQDDNWTLVTNGAASDSARLTISLRVAETTALEDGLLRLGAVDQTEVGVVRLHAGQSVSAEVRTVPAHLPADPTIAGTVDFIKAEARYYQKRRDDDHSAQG
jgi:hypothetical protein